MSYYTNHGLQQVHVITNATILTNFAHVFSLGIASNKYCSLTICLENRDECLLVIDSVPLPDYSNSLCLFVCSFIDIFICCCKTYRLQISVLIHQSLHTVLESVSKHIRINSYETVPLRKKKLPHR